MPNILNNDGNQKSLLRKYFKSAHKIFCKRIENYTFQLIQFPKTVSKLTIKIHRKKRSLIQKSSNLEKHDAT